MIKILKCLEEFWKYNLRIELYFEFVCFKIMI